MKTVLINIGRVFLKPFGPRFVEKVISFLATAGNVDLLPFAYEYMGIPRWNGGNLSETGEAQVINEVLPKYFGARSPVIFDVGANVGKYSNALARQFPTAKIWAFEPNPQTFKDLAGNVAASVRCVNAGLGAERGQGKIYCYEKENSVQSEHASIYLEVISDLHGSKSVMELPFEMDTIDDFCLREKIDEIDFLKIDTEGHEYAALTGASRMLKESRIKLIQFEFNSMNVISRVFLRDFFELLPQYSFFRLHPQGLLPLKEYKVSDEIFVLQNLLAVHRDLGQPV